MSDELETITQAFSSPAEEILFHSYEAYKQIKDLVLVDEYGAFRQLDKDQWEQLGVLAEEGFRISSKNWGRLISRVEAFQERDNQDTGELEALVQEMKTRLRVTQEEYSEVLKAKESLAVSMERVLAELTNFSVIPEPIDPQAPDFTVSDKGGSFWLEALKATIGLRTRSLLAQFIVRYNQQFGRSQVLFDKIEKLQEEDGKEGTIDRLKVILFGLEEFENEKSIISLLQQELEEFEGGLEDYQRTIYQKAKEEPDLPSFFQLLEEFLGWLMEHIPNFAETQVKLHFLLQLLYQGDNKALATRIGRVAAAAGDIQREAFSSFSATMVLWLHAMGVPLSGSKASLLDFPSSYRFHRSIPDGKWTKVENFSDVSGDELIEVRGFVKTMETFRDSSNKLISRLILEEIRGGDTFAAEAIFLHLRHEGIAPGAYCHLQATLRDPISYEGSEIPRLLIDKLSIKTELISESWKMAFLNLSYPYFERWPNGLNLKYSLSPHHPHSEDDQHKLGGADLGFKPMVN